MVTGQRGLGDRGQIVIEYVLLMIFAFTIAAILTRAMVGRDKDNPGFVIEAWQAMLQQIGADRADDINRASN